MDLLRGAQQKSEEDQDLERRQDQQAENTG